MRRIEHPETAAWLGLAAFWIIYGAICLFLGAYLTAVFALGGLFIVLVSSATTTTYRRRLAAQQRLIQVLKNQIEALHARR